MFLAVTSCGADGEPSSGTTIATVPAEPATGVVPAPLTSTLPASTVPTVTAPSTSTSTGDLGRGADPGVAIEVGAARAAGEGFTLLRGRRVGLITNTASQIDGQPLVEVLAHSAEVDLVVVFSPEHGVDGGRPAGVAVDDSADTGGGFVVRSLYGVNRAPTPASLSEVDVLVFDLQDVGVRAYTYLSTMGLAMEAAAKADIPFVVFDRPNPLGGRYLGGFTRRSGFESFISQYPVPAAHGLTAGELAQAIQGEGWLPGLEQLDLQVVTMTGWQRADTWSATGLDWLPPSPSLPTVEAAAVYPATVLFEATTMSLGRGTAEPFTLLGSPWVDGVEVAAELNQRQLPGVRFEPAEFTPVASPSVPSPTYEGERLTGIRIVVTDEARVEAVELGVHLLEVFWRHGGTRGVGPLIDRGATLDLLAGGGELRAGIEAGVSASAIIDQWQAEIEAFDTLRRPYLLYD